MDKLGSLWAITAYFNPMHFDAKLRNFHTFRKHLGVPLLAVEFNREQEFELTKHDSDILIQLSSGDTLWQKEALLNVGVRHLPPSCENVVLLDADVIFGHAGWCQNAARLLRDVVLVQPFEAVVDLERRRSLPLMATGLRGLDSLPLPPLSRMQSELDGYRLSFAKAWTEGHIPAEYFNTDVGRRQTPVAPGFALAGKRQFFAENRLFDQAVIGGGDSLLWGAIAGKPENVADRLNVYGNYRRVYLDWARVFGQVVGKNVGFVPGRLFHLWHGKLENRQYYKREAELNRMKFDPNVDLVRSEDGIWFWSKRRPDLRRFALDYFELRKEDE